MTHRRRRTDPGPFCHSQILSEKLKLFPNSKQGRALVLYSTKHTRLILRQLFPSNSNICPLWWVLFCPHNSCQISYAKEWSSLEEMMNNPIGPIVKHLWNVTMYVLYTFWGFVGRQNSLQLEPKQAFIFFYLKLHSYWHIALVCSSVPRKNPKVCLIFAEITTTATTL